MLGAIIVSEEFETELVEHLGSLDRGALFGVEGNDAPCDEIGAGEECFGIGGEGGQGHEGGQQDQDQSHGWSCVWPG